MTTDDISLQRPYPLDDRRSRRVLLVAYEFPPFRSSGVYRPLKWARYLPEFGWEPVILTAQNRSAGQLDYSLLADLPPDIELVHVPALELDRLEQWLFDRLTRFRNTSHRGGIDPEPRVALALDDSDRRLAKRAISALARWARSFLYVPDARVGWLPRASLAGLRRGFHAIVTTSPPASTHLVGLVLAALTRRPWIADFRDPWTDNFDVQELPRVRRRLDRILERMVLRRADRIVNVGASFAALSRESFPEVPPSKHAVIPNGYDEADFASLDPPGPAPSADNAVLRLINVGTIYPNSAFDQFLDGLEAVLRDEESAGPSVNLELVGDDVSPAQSDRLSRPPFLGRVHRLGFYSHRDALRVMLAADVLLLIPSGGTERSAGYVIPGKMFELMRCGRPILMIGWPGEAADIVTRSGLGTFVRGDRPDLIAAAIRALRDQKRSGSLRVVPDWTVIRQYDRRALAGQLAGLLDELHGRTTAIRR